ncbi:hypothetical protein GCM10011487_09300 [Steroidobacter agaridevorans]|uniref:Uncharacterized protein n=1 Tax=Steroidobacter agaridevorans TaxID=2695856 RepID=A0A829Y6U1_9GAMM|nr:hypothetical protein [Steroidobacter agaridevorans]GFE78930.1 hypothetical protein GCM10011487_09300 [Steroidobacter agaridevorans]GFE88083.1 hypothetical protein GCM10011488_30370 [Steroidobacter agaridevorans]
MSGSRSYLAAAFNARPFGMPVPPNWFGIAAFALLGAFVNPGLWLIGAGLEGLYLWVVSRNERFRATVDAGGKGDDWVARYNALSYHLDEDARRRQESIEFQAREIVDLLSRTGATEMQKSDVRQMAWLHLKLLAARASVLQVINSAEREKRALEEQERRVIDRLSEDAIGDELKRSLEQQLEVLRSRRAGHADAQHRRELIEAELERLRQQVSLVREQALLATDEHSVASSLDALSASLNEANRWLKDQRELFSGLDGLTDEPPPEDLLRPRASTRRRGERIAQ